MQLKRFLLTAGFLAAPLLTYAAGQQLVPAGSLLTCTVSEKVSSETTNVGDPIVCMIGHSTFPSYGGSITGTFQEYKDPGHLVGKGWMELQFDRVVLPPNQILQVSAKVVHVPGYHVDREGRILGNGHPVRDTVEWLIPVLWPIDLINLPRRGPRPVLKPETRLTVKLMDDLLVPTVDQQPERDPYGFSQRQPVTYYQPAPQYVAPAPAPVYYWTAPPVYPYAPSMWVSPALPPVVFVPHGIYNRQAPVWRGYRR